MVAFGRLAVTGRFFLGVLVIYLVYVAISLLLPGEESHTLRHLQQEIPGKGCEGEGCVQAGEKVEEEENSGQKAEEEENIRLRAENAKLLEENSKLKELPVEQVQPWIAENTDVRIWIDLPNGEFVKRLCLQEYSNFLTMMSCNRNEKSQVFTLRPTSSALTNNSLRSFDLLLPDGRCLEPSERMTSKEKKRSVFGSKSCSSSWTWNSLGELVWEGGLPWEQDPVSCGQHMAASCAECPRDEKGNWIGEHMCHGECTWADDSCVENKPLPVYKGCPMCLTGLGENVAMGVDKCKWVDERQLVEVGNFFPDEDGLGKYTLRPLDIGEWQGRQDGAKDELKKQTKLKVTQALEEIKVDEMMASLDTTSEAQKNRRAVVFYMDRGKSGKQQLNWWIKAWQFSGLDEPGEAFDIVVMVHPSGVPDIKEQCTLVTPQFSAKFNGSGKCFYKPYIGIAHREPGYDKYMNSQECLIGPGTDFLADYKILLRADMDTFPTPRFRGFWPEGVLVDSHYSTNFNLRSIKHALKKVACEAGLEHKGLYNPGSTWYGDARRVRHMAKLTVALNKFGRASLFGPGTLCRCAECKEINPACAWSKGIYPGVLLLYMQELAVNRVITKEEWDNLPSGLFDQGVSSTVTTVCGPALLHCYQHQELFSKLAFGINKYVDYDMSKLDITVVSGYAAYMALTSNGQGKNGEVALEALHRKTNGLSIAEWCTKHPT